MSKLIYIRNGAQEVPSGATNAAKFTSLDGKEHLVQYESSEPPSATGVRVYELIEYVLCGVLFVSIVKESKGGPLLGSENPQTFQAKAMSYSKPT